MVLEVRIKKELKILIKKSHELMARVLEPGISMTQFKSRQIRFNYNQGIKKGLTLALEFLNEKN